MRISLSLVLLLGVACGDDDASTSPPLPPEPTETGSGAAAEPQSDPEDTEEEVPEAVGYTGTGFDPEPFATCTSDDECVALRSACFTAAVHRDHQTTYSEQLRGVRFRCEPPPGGRWPAIAAACRDGLCAVVTAAE